ncbi:cupredoxin domain-containing protein [Streptomyces exfoliatus]|uniref:cupredoxin domain-containing protein n=1 Tax=Streptomyces exfoliatus TaxID=1905 RepID=UPI0037880A59
MLTRPRRRGPHTVLPLVLLFLVTTLAGCSDSGGTSTPTSPSASPTSVTPAQEARIVIKNFRFEPSDLTVAPGTEITVVNEDSTPHTVTAEAANAFDTSTIQGGKTATFTAPPTAGTYPYLCDIHQSMRGTLTVR